jgi:hypothetical protein
MRTIGRVPAPSSTEDYYLTDAAKKFLKNPSSFGLSSRMRTVVVDVWDVLGSGQHLARSVLTLDAALEMARLELVAGYSVNLWVNTGWGSEQNFEHRTETRSPTSPS